MAWGTSLVWRVFLFRVLWRPNDRRLLTCLNLELVYVCSFGTMVSLFDNPDLNHLSIGLTFANFFHIDSVTQTGASWLLSKRKLSWDIEYLNFVFVLLCFSLLFLS